MKKTLLTLAVAGMTLSASAQDKGRFEVYDLGNFKLHVYSTPTMRWATQATSSRAERLS